MRQEIWKYYDGYKVYVENYKFKQKLDGWKDFKLSCRYRYADGNKGWDYIFPAKRYNRVARLLKLPLRKRAKVEF